VIPTPSRRPRATPAGRCRSSRRSSRREAARSRYAHAAEDEAFFLLDGELEFLDGDRTFIAGPGSFVFIPRTRRHRFKNLGATDARALFLFTPAGPEDFFIEGGDDPEPGKRPVVWDMDRVMQVADIAERTGLTVLPETP